MPSSGFDAKRDVADGTDITNNTSDVQCRLSCQPCVKFWKYAWEQGAGAQLLSARRNTATDDVTEEPPLTRKCHTKAYRDSVANVESSVIPLHMLCRPTL